MEFIIYRKKIITIVILFFIVLFCNKNLVFAVSSSAYSFNKLKYIKVTRNPDKTEYKVGNIYMRTNNSDVKISGHMCIIAGFIYDKNYNRIGVKTFDCGGKTPWKNNKNGNPHNGTDFLTDPRKGKIIRIK